MSTTERRLAANRANALLSTGPATAEGKAKACRNATRHALLSTRMFLDDENPAEFEELFRGLWFSLNPVGAIEDALVERIAVTIWRQRRLVQAETSVLTLARQPRKVARGVSSELGRGFGAEVMPEDLTPFDAEQEAWCRAAMAEIDALDEPDLAVLQQHAPLVFGQLEDDAEEERVTPAKYVANLEGGIAGYIADLASWCREQLRHAEARPHILALAEQVRAACVVLPTEMLELFARYQTTLDNQLFKALRALREAQEWRLKTLEPIPASKETDIEEMAQAA